MAAAPSDHPASISDQTIAILEQATHSRGWIVQSFSQVEFMLGDFRILYEDFELEVPEAD